jgi:hypothetical protein
MFFKKTIFSLFYRQIKSLYSLAGLLRRFPLTTTPPRRIVKKLSIKNAIKYEFTPPPPLKKSGAHVCVCPLFLTSLKYLYENINPAGRGPGLVRLGKVGICLGNEPGPATVVRDWT